MKKRSILILGIAAMALMGCTRYSFFIPHQPTPIELNSCTYTTLD